MCWLEFLQSWLIAFGLSQDWCQAKSQQVQRSAEGWFDHPSRLLLPVCPFQSICILERYPNSDLARMPFATPMWTIKSYSHEPKEPPPESQVDSSCRLAVSNGKFSFGERSPPGGRSHAQGGNLLRLTERPRQPTHAHQTDRSHVEDYIASWQICGLELDTPFSLST